jgi:hypothetical protein
MGNPTTFRSGNLESTVSKFQITEFLMLKQVVHTALQRCNSRQSGRTGRSRGTERVLDMISTELNFH